MAGTRFCEECGKPLNPGTKFCEECGAPVQPESGSPMPPAPLPATGPDLPLAVIPFGYQPRGIVSTADLVLVMYPGKLVLASVPEGRDEEFRKANNEVYDTIEKKYPDGRKFWELAAPGAGLFREPLNPSIRGIIAGTSHNAAPEPGMLPRNRPWERYLSMTSAMVLAEDNRNREIPWEDITYIRGDWEGPSGVILIRLPSGTTRIFFSNWIYHLARSALLSFLVRGNEVSERILGVLPEAEEPMVEDLFYQWFWMVVVTDKRLWFAAAGDDEDGEDCPESLEELAKNPVSDLLKFGGAFFIPLEAVRRVTIVPTGGIRKREQISFELPGETLSMKLPKGTADQARAVLSPVLPGKVQ